MRKSIFVLVFSFFAIFANANIYTGTCGENISWSFNSEDSTLYINGTGDMEHYSSLGTSAPYLSYGTIKNVHISEGVTSIGTEAFGNCTHLENITIPTTVSSISNRAFRSCTALHNIDFPNGLRSIGANAFFSCLALDSIIIPNSVDYIGEGAFQGCSAAKKLILSNQLTRIEFAAFNSCRLIPAIEIFEGVTFIDDFAFSNCSAVRTIILPSTLETIDREVFSNNTTLESITCYASNPPYVAPYEIKQIGPYTIKTGGVFPNVPTDIPLYVPAESVELYRAADQWKDFGVTAIPAENNATYTNNPSFYHDEVFPRKMMQNGQILILRGDKTYTMTGQEVR